MKKMMAFLLALAMALSLGACAGSEEISSQASGGGAAVTGNEGGGTSDESLHRPLSIYNAQKEEIGKIEYDGMITPTSGGFVYMKTGASETEWEFHLYTFATGESVKLGSVQNLYMRPFHGVVLQNHLFTFVVTMEGEEPVSRLMDLDLGSHTMSELYSEAGSFYYNSMVSDGDRLLFVKVMANESRLEEYNLSTKEKKVLKSFPFDDAKGLGESVRCVYTDGDTISLLLMVKETEDSVQLRVDVYDRDMKFLESRDVTGISDREDELRQRIANFVYSDGLLYYQNISSTRFFGKVTDTGLEKCMDVDIVHKMAYDAVQNPDTRLLFCCANESNALYLLDMKTGDVRESSFFAEDRNYQFLNIFRDTNGSLLIVMAGRDPSTGQKLPYRLYYVSESDLHFS